MKPNFAMTIGGSDPSAGAGIQADLKAFTSLGLHGVTIITSVTAQNSQQVKKIIPLSQNEIQDQIECIMQDMPINHVKTGLLYDSEIAQLISRYAKKYKWSLIVDPVLVATSGDLLHKSNLTREIKKSLLPTSTIITPNIPEAETLSEITISNEDDMKKAAIMLYSKGAKNIIIKGGHLKDELSLDLLYDGTCFTTLSLPRIPHKKAHGSGCTFSALLTGLLAQGKDIKTAFSESKHILWNMINNGYTIGKGSDVLQINKESVTNAPKKLLTVNHTHLWMELSNISQKISEIIPLQFIPEVGINIGYALESAKTKNEVCALNGRIVRSKTKPIYCGSVQFGASKHIASIILAVMNKYPKIRSAMNIKYSKENIMICKKCQFHIESFNRKNEPSTVSSSMEWGTQSAIEKSNTCPDIIYDTGGIGKEPMIRILGGNPSNLYKKLNLIIKTSKTI